MTKIKQTAKDLMRTCQHPRKEILTLGEHYLWCGKCGSTRRNKWPSDQWAEPIVMDATRDLVSHLRANVGDSADWPIQLKISEEDAPKLVELLNRVEESVT